MSSYQPLPGDADGLLVGASQFQGSYRSFPDPKTSQPAILDSQKLPQIVVDSAQNGQEMVTMNQSEVITVVRLVCANHPNFVATNICSCCQKSICPACTKGQRSEGWGSLTLICPQCEYDIKLRKIKVVLSLVLFVLVLCLVFIR
eukprot:TRINITY_DN756_c0_g1_i1.p1 TRINITY_DN756_c0_g1~~TRINITY_DN756_c0_g1_i1.p1  ORF type:complete len:145 (-),score=15.66 TRINITY_DN756_c0_g1_i1:111-545(-)